MSEAAKILMRRMGTKAEAGRKGGLGGLLGMRETHVVLDGDLTADEVLCLVSNSGEKAESVTKSTIADLCGEKQGLGDGEMLFAVLRSSFLFRMTIPAGEDADGYPWFFEVGGMLEILKPQSFARTFRGIVGKDEPLTSSGFEEMLGTMPATVLHDKVLVDVLGVMSLGEKDGENRYVDMRKRLNQEKGVGEKYVATAVTGTFEEFFGEKDVVRLRVTSFRARSPECEAEIERRKDWQKRQALEAELKEIEAQEKRIAAEQEKNERERRVRDAADLRKKELDDEQHKTDLARLQAERNRIKAEEAEAAEQRKRDAEVAAKKHEVELAELEAQKKKLEKGSTESAFEAFEMLSNVLGNAVAENGAGTLFGLVQDARRTETGLRLLALAKDRRKRGGGLKLTKNKRTYGLRTVNGVQDRGLLPLTAKTPVLHQWEMLSSTIACERRGGFLTVLNVSEKSEVVPLLPNGDYPEDMKISRGERMVIADESCERLTGLQENATSGTDHLVAFVTDEPLLAQPLPPLGEALPDAVVSRLVARLSSMNDASWEADVNSFTVLP